MVVQWQRLKRLATVTKVRLADSAYRAPGLVVGGRIPLTLGGRLAGRAAAHLLPGLVVTGLAADVEVDELRVVHLTHDAVL